MNIFVRYHFRARDRSPYFIYSLVLGSVGLSAFAAHWLTPFSRQAPFVLFVPGVLFALWYAGFRAALVATGLSTAAIFFSFGLPTISSNWGFFAFRLATFVATMALASWVIDRHHARDASLIRMQQALIENANEPMLIKDEADHIVFWNRGAERLYGWSKEEALGTIPEQLLAAEYPQPLSEMNRECAEKSCWTGVVTRNKKDGSALTIESSWNCYTDPLLGQCVLQSDHDVTERNSYIRELNALNHILRAVTATNRALVHAKSEKELMDTVVAVLASECGYAVSWVAIPQEDGSVVFPSASGGALKYLANTQVDWRTGEQPAAVVLRTGEVCLIPDVLTFPGLAHYKDRLIERGIGSGICLPLKDDGKTIGALNVSHPLPNAFSETDIRMLQEIAGDLAFGMSSLRAKLLVEETARAHALLEDQLRQSQKMEAVGQLAGGIAHDFNNLLMVIMAHGELLLLSGLPPEGTRRALASIQAARKAADLTRQLLAFSRKQVLQPSVLNINQAIENISSILQRVLGEDIDFKTFFATDLSNVQVDRSQLEQILMNLAVNARDAMPNGGSLTIETSNVELGSEHSLRHPVHPPGLYVMMAVTDTGTGMSPEIQERIFEPFFTTKPEGKGTGLGLSTVYGIVKQSGGFVWLYSEVGKGTSFKVYFPRSLSAAGSQAEPLKPARPISKAATILVVEDDEGLRQVIGDFLSGHSYKVLMADSVESATQVALENRDQIDLLFTDVVLKGGNGRVLVRNLAEQGCHFRVLYMSGYTPSSIIHHGVLDEGTHFLQKPFARSTLLDKVEEVLAMDLTLKQAG